MLWLKTLLTEKEELEDLVEQYEANVSNATSLRVRIMEIVNNEKYSDDKFKEKVLQRISYATDGFKYFIDEERDLTSQSVTVTD
jgi:signal transduction histidine kinase